MALLIGSHTFGVVLDLHIWEGVPPGDSSQDIIPMED